MKLKQSKLWYAWMTFSMISALWTSEGFAAEASEGFHIGFRGGLSVGAWWGNLTESYGGSSTSIDLHPAYGGTLIAGLHFGPIFVDYTPSYLGVGKLNDSLSGPSNSYYLTLLAGEVGISLDYFLKFLPLEVFIGYENGSLAFSTGAQSQFGGSVLKIGVNLVFRVGPASIGLRGEYRRNYFTLQNYSPTPTGLDVSSYTYFVGPVILF